MSGYPYYPYAQQQAQPGVNIYGNPVPPQLPQERPMQQLQQMQAPGYNCRPVTSREEAVGAPTNYVGPGDVFVDIGHGMMYLKRFNPQTGTSDFLDFARVAPAAAAPAPAPQPSQDYISAAAFNAVIKRLSDELDDVRAELDGLQAKKKGKAGAEP